MKKFLQALSVACALAHACAWAVLPPKEVTDMAKPEPESSAFMRVDSRPPRVIFESGFVPWGGANGALNPLEHVRGRACTSHGFAAAPTGFVSTTTDWNVILRLAPMMGLYGSPIDPPHSVYVYWIRPTARIYDAYRSLEYMNEHPELYTNQALPNQTGFPLVPEMILNESRQWDEWLAAGGIARDQISVAIRLEIQADGRLVPREAFQNTRYSNRPVGVVSMTPFAPPAEGVVSVWRGMAASAARMLISMCELPLQDTTTPAPPVLPPTPLLSPPMILGFPVL